MKKLKEIPNKKEKNREKILIDYREKNSLVPSELISLGHQIEFRELKVGDYLVKDVAIERKTINDFIASMKNKRLINQLEELQQYNQKLLIIEGIEEQELYNEENSGMHSNSIRGFLLSILLNHNVPIIFTKNASDTSKFISVLHNKKEKGAASLNVKKKVRNKKEQLQFIIESFPSIGPKTAQKLLIEFKTIKNFIIASPEELEKVIGKKAEIVKKLIDEKY